MTLAVTAAPSQTYARLKSDITAAKIMDRCLSFYVPLILFAFGGYFLSAWAIYTFDFGSILPLVLGCLGFSFFGVQIAGLMHDSGHRAVFASQKANDILGYTCSAAIGMIFDNWRVRHNAHHGHPNQHSLDPDMEIPFIATTDALFSKKRGLERLVTRWQAFYYHPLGTLVGITNRLGAVTFFFHNKEKRSIWKFLLYVPANIVSFAGPFILFSPEKAIFVFLVVHMTSGVYLSNCFAPNHKGMQQLPADAQMSFFEQQVVTARNVRGGFFTDLILVGLNRQIEHHLFPMTPRNKLHLLTPFVLDACRRDGVPYTEVSFIETNRFLMRHLSTIAKRPLGYVSQETSIGG